MDVRPAPGSDGDAGVPTCFRHPDRPTYLSCSRCGRPACPDCLRPAPVGQHCVECVHGDSRAVRRATGPFGGRPAGTPIVTWVLIGLNVILWIAEWINVRVVYDLWMVNAYVAHGQFYRLLSSAFLHEWGLSGFGITHILFNMWALYVVGPSLERLLGHSRYLALYLLSALGGSALFYLLAPPFQPALGASGAIFGLFGAYFVVARRLRVSARGVVFLIVLNLAITFVVPNIAWEAHVGGLVTGALVAAAYVYAPRQRRTLVQVAASLVMLAAIAAIVLLRDSQLASIALR